MNAAMASWCHFRNACAMTRLDHLALLADYNRWMNEKIYAAAHTLSPQELARERGAFFRSILGTLNHLAVADTVWLLRLRRHPARFKALAALDGTTAPTALDATLFDDLDALRRYRLTLDDVIAALTLELSEPDLDTPLAYTNMKGAAQRKKLHAVLLHLFNHQTHHRGQVSTLLFQAGVDVGVTDLVALIPDVAAQV
jgi:uncharacterized damage-inducible protein DinB